MNEGEGKMLQLAKAYQHGVITEDILKVICDENDWSYKKDNSYGVLIFPKIIKNCFTKKENLIAKKIRKIDIFFIKNVRIPNMNPNLSPAIDKTSDMLKKLYDEIQEQ